MDRGIHPVSAWQRENFPIIQRFVHANEQAAGTPLFANDQLLKTFQLSPFPPVKNSFSCVPSFPVCITSRFVQL
jgi:hypothetical protein